MNKQTLNITLEFQVEHSPGNEAHLHQIAENYFRPKGIQLEDDNVIRL